MALNSIQSSFEELKVDDNPKEVIEQFYDFFNNIPFIQNLTKSDRKRAKDLPRDAEGKIKVLEQDYRYDMQSLASDIDKAVEQDAFARAEEIEQIQNSDTYKQQKLEAMQTIAMLRQCNAEIPPEIFTDLIADVVAAKDVRSLELIGLMCGKGMCQAMTAQVIHNINVSNQNKALTQFADSAKSFLENGEISLTLMGHMKLYE